MLQRRRKNTHRRTTHLSRMGVLRLRIGAGGDQSCAQDDRRKVGWAASILPGDKQKALPRQRLRNPGQLLFVGGGRVLLGELHPSRFQFLLHLGNIVGIHLGGNGFVPLLQSALVVGRGQFEASGFLV